MTDHIITANRLHDGQVIFQTTDGWTEDLAQARVIADSAELSEWLARAEADADIAVGAYEVPVAVTADGPLPLKFRERLRTAGPSIRYLKSQAA